VLNGSEVRSSRGGAGGGRREEGPWCPRPWAFPFGAFTWSPDSESAEQSESVGPSVKWAEHKREDHERERAVWQGRLGVRNRVGRGWRRGREGRREEIGVRGRGKQRRDSPWNG